MAAKKKPAPARKRKPAPAPPPPDDPAEAELLEGELAEPEEEDGEEGEEEVEEEVEPGTCRYCGCTEEQACPEGCAWADDTLTVCTTCQEIALEMGYSALDALVELEGRFQR
jgi:hypothetical protein